MRIRWALFSRIGSPSLFVLNTSLWTNHFTAVQNSEGTRTVETPLRLRNNFNRDVTCSCLNVQKYGGVTVLICIVPLRCPFYLSFSLLFTRGREVDSGWGGWTRLDGCFGVGGWVGFGIFNTNCHNARTSSIYCFRDCLSYLVCCPFLKSFHFLNTLYKYSFLT